ncbi:MAG TPA: hypothetical protein VGW57_04600 [Chthoniobacterales bacterium]|nr:hypothetical protein [Chthoniobacterales bacterium]
MAAAVTVVGVGVVPDARVVTGGGVELITAVVLLGVGFVVRILGVLVVPLAVEVVPVGMIEIKVAGEIAICPLVVGDVLFRTDTS